MTRDPGRLVSQPFDVLVVGGGIHGLFAAREAAARGASVALVERDDFASGLSFNHQRTVHGGLRALEHGHIFKVLEQVRERRHWARIAPALLRPLPFLVPLRRGERPSKHVLSAGLRVYDALGSARNEDVVPACYLPSSRLLGTDETRGLAPGLSAEALTGSAIWYDYQTVYPDRLSHLVALAAERAGAVLVNHAEAITDLRRGDRVVGARVRDRLTGQEFEVEAKATILAAGAGLASAYRSFGLDDEPPALVAAANILVKRPGGSHAIAARGPSGRRLTAVPWAEMTLVGTFQGDSVTTPEGDFPISLETMLAEANATFPWLALARTDVALVHRGLVPAEVGQRVELLADSHLVRHGLRGVSGVISIVGVKFTTARLTAREAVQAVFEEAGISEQDAASGHTALPYGFRVDQDDIVRRAAGVGVDAESATHLASWYAGEAEAVIDYAATTGLVERLTASGPVIEAEVAYAVEHAAARRLSDVVLRRTWLGAAGDPGDAALERAAAIMGGMLGWSDNERIAQIASVRERYAL